MVSSNQPAWLQWLDACPSTNSWALANLDQLQHGDVVFTQNQTAGRGQHGRIWYSPSGGLTASFVLGAIAIARLSELSLLAGLAVIDAIEDLCPDLQNRLRLKWSNDVLLDGKKLAGILCESVIHSSTDSARAVVGIGLNRHADLDAETLRATSLHQWVTDVPGEMQLLERLRQALLNVSHPESGGLAAVLPELRSRDFLLGKAITVELAGEKISGEAAGISDRGHLLLRLPNGDVKSLISGHILW